MPSNLLPPDAADRVVGVCRELIGDRLRSVTYFTQNDYEQLYLREDLARDADLESFTGVEWHESSIIDDAYGTSELGGHNFTIRVFENGYLLRVSGANHGLFVTTDDLSMATFERLGEALADLVGELPEPTPDG